MHDSLNFWFNLKLNLNTIKKRMWKNKDKYLDKICAEHKYEYHV